MKESALQKRHIRYLSRDQLDLLIRVDEYKDYMPHDASVPTRTLNALRQTGLLWVNETPTFAVPRGIRLTVQGEQVVAAYHWGREDERSAQETQQD